MNHSSTTNSDLPPALSGSGLVLLLLAAAGGALLAVMVLPAWLPGLRTSLDGADPKAYWYLARSSGLIAYVLVWLSLMLGVLITNRLAKVWPGGPTAYDLHQFSALLGLAFGLFHGLILLGDHYIQLSLAQILLPFSAAGYRPFWVGIGQVGFYLLGVVGLSFYIRGKIGPRTWRLIHYLSFAVFLLTLSHAVFSGSDSGLAGIQWLYWTTGAGFLFMTLYRVLASVWPQTPAKAQIRRGG